MMRKRHRPASKQIRVEFPKVALARLAPQRSDLQYGQVTYRFPATGYRLPATGYSYRLPFPVTSIINPEIFK